MNVPGDKKRPLVEAKCTNCRHVGKSRYPETYRCTACYYNGKADANWRKAEELRVRARVLDREASVFAGKAAAFMRRHPGAGAQK